MRAIIYAVEKSSNDAISKVDSKVDRHDAVCAERYNWIREGQTRLERVQTEMVMEMRTIARETRDGMAAISSSVEKRINGLPWKAWLAIVSIATGVTGFIGIVHYFVGGA